MTDLDAPVLQDETGPSVRRADLSDIDALAEIERLAFASDRLSRRSLRAFVAAPSAALLVAQVQNVSGYALVLFRKGSRTARLYSLAVKPGVTRRGVGSCLLSAAEAIARQKGADRLRLEVRADNAGAVRFYQAHGYALFGRCDSYYADGMDAFRLERPLSPTNGRGVADSGSEGPETICHG